MRRSHLWSLCVIWIAACGEVEPDPNAEVSGYLQFELIGTTTLEPLNDLTPVQLTIVGRPGAATNLGMVTAVNVRSAERQTSDVSPAGSFVLNLDALAGDTITLTHEGAGQPVSLELSASPHPQFPTPAPGGIVVSAPDGNGDALVQLTLLSPAGNALMFVSNHHNHHVAQLTATTPTRAVGHIPAQSGDGLLLWAVIGGATTDAHLLVVP